MEPTELKPFFAKKLRGSLIYFCIFLIYLAIAVIVFMPVSLHIFSVVFGTGGDIYQNMWGMWWVDYAIFTLHTSIWHTSMIFAPLGASLIYETMAPLASMLVAPFMVFGIPFAYNVMNLLGFAFSALGMFFLADYLVGNKYAAFVSGVIFSFSAFHITTHIDFIFLLWIPIALLFLFRLIDGKGRLASSIGLGISVAFSTLSGDMQLTIMLLMAIVLIVAIYLASRDRRKVLSLSFWKYTALAALVAFIAGMYAYIPMLHAVLSGGLGTVNQLNSIGNNILYSDNLLSFFLPSPNNAIFAGASKAYFGIYGYLGSYDISERVAYIGYVALAFSAFALYKKFGKAKLWLIVALVFMLLALGPLMQLGPVVPSVHYSNGNFTFSGIPGLYKLYSAIPALNIIREPGRFDMMAELAFAAMAAFGIAEFIKNRSARQMLAISAVLAAVVIIEAAGIIPKSATTTIQIPAFFSGMASNPRNFTFLYIPALPSQSDTPELYPGKAMFYSAIARKPTLTGYLTRANNSEYNLLMNIPLVIQASYLQAYNTSAYYSVVNENYTNQTLLALYMYNTAVIAVDTTAFSQIQLSELYSMLAGTFGMPIYSNSTMFFITANAIASHVFRSFVSFPIPSDWVAYKVMLNGTNATAWLPLNYGSIMVYAPYANQSSISSIANAYAPAGRVNATISFEAFAYPGNEGKIGIYTLSGSNHTILLASFPVSHNQKTYSLNASFVSGPQGNIIMFIPSASSYVLINNITIERRN